MARTRYKVTGVDEARRELSRVVDGIGANSVDAVALAGQFLKGEAQKLTSIDEGTLIKTAFSKPSGGTKNPSVTVGYTASYAAAVHEMPDDTRWNRPGAENQFLTKAINRNVTRILNLMANVMRRRP